MKITNINKNEHALDACVCVCHTVKCVVDTVEETTITSKSKTKQNNDPSQFHFF